MNTQQPMYLFAGGRGRSILTTFSNVGKIIKNTGKVKPNIAFVGVASLKDNWLIYTIISTLIKAGGNCQTTRVVIAPHNADIKKAREMLQNADAVFISGGDAEAGMEILKEKNMARFLQDLARQGKLFLGGSAGSIMMSKGWVRWRDPDDDATAELYPCLGLVPIFCDTHAEKDDWVELKTALQLEGAGTPGYGIPSGACLKVYPDGRLEAEGGAVARYHLLNGKVERQADLLPADRTGQLTPS
jgi:peptidase E